MTELFFFSLPETILNREMRCITYNLLVRKSQISSYFFHYKTQSERMTYKLVNNHPCPYINVMYYKVFKTCFKGCRSHFQILCGFNPDKQFIIIFVANTQVQNNRDSFFF